MLTNGTSGIQSSAGQHQKGQGGHGFCEKDRKECRACKDSSDKVSHSDSFVC